VEVVAVAQIIRAPAIRVVLADSLLAVVAVVARPLLLRAAA
jgi:hypothetical protein